MSKVKLYLGDCLEILPMLANDGIDAIVTDPPYGRGAYETDRRIGNPLILLGTMAPTLAIFSYPEEMVADCVEAKMIPDEWITWWPTNKTTRATGLLRETEVIAIFGPIPGARELMVKRMGIGSLTAAIAQNRGLDPQMRRAGDVFRDPSPGMAFLSHLRQHPNEKPVSLLRRIVVLCCQDTGTVLDPFMGSGTTGVACVQLGRSFIGIEIDPTYYAIAEKRIAEAQAQPLLPTFRLTSGCSQPLAAEQIRMGFDENGDG